MGNKDDRTIIVPRPGGRGPIRGAGAPPPPPPSFGAPPPPPPSAGVAAPPPPPAYGVPGELSLTRMGLNPLVDAAAPLLALIGQVRTLSPPRDVEVLRRQTLDQIRNFESQTQAAGISADVAFTARYVLCTVIDEAVLGTLWGSSSMWASQALLSTLHNESHGGERFYLILDRLLRDPSGSLELMELMYLCVCLGFRGQYSVVERGDEKLDHLRSVVFEHIRRRRGELPHELSEHWQGYQDRRNALARFVPLWVIAAVTGVILMSIFFGFTWVLEEYANPIVERLDGIAPIAAVEQQPPQ